MVLWTLTHFQPTQSGYNPNFPIRLRFWNLNPSFIQPEITTTRLATTTLFVKPKGLVIIGNKESPLQRPNFEVIKLIHFDQSSSGRDQTLVECKPS